MRRTSIAIACAALLAVPAGDAWAAVQAKATAAARKKVVTVSKSATSPLVDVSRWGQLQVAIKVNLITTTVGTKKTRSFKITDVKWPVYPSHTDRSAYISSQALPLLRQEVLQLKGNTLQLVSGATDTSYAFVEALRGALTMAGA
jgi:uncharacterized protein with FMN-binding domain